MEIGDIVFHQEYGVGKIKFIDGLAYLVYYYKENPLLHNDLLDLISIIGGAMLKT